MYDYPRVELDQAALSASLRQLSLSRGVSIELEQASYHAPGAIDELAELYRNNPDAQLLAGGTDVGLWVTKQLRELPAVIYLGNVAELQSIKCDTRGIEIGAAVSLTDAFDKIVPDYPEFAEMFRRFASVPVRNAGTLVGNVANGSPIGDSMPALMVCDASVKLRCGSEQREIALPDLYLDYMKNALQAGEFIESLLIPARDDGLQIRCYKLSKRFDQDISALCAAFAIALDGDRIVDARIAFGGMAAIPERASQTEQWLLDKNWDEVTLEGAEQKLRGEFAPLSDMRASADYRSRASANLLRRFFLETRPGQRLRADQVNVFAVSA